MKNRDTVFIFTVGILIGALGFGFLSTFHGGFELPSLSAVEWSATISASATVALAILTFVYVRLTARVLAAQSDPYVAIMVTQAFHGPLLLQLLVKNTGKGMARDISFDLSWHESEDLSAVTPEAQKFLEELNFGIIKDGIPVLGPGEERRLHLNTFNDVYAILADRKIAATCNFKSDFRRMPPVESVLDVKSFQGTSAADPPILKVANKLERIEENLRHLTTGNKKLHVNISSSFEQKNSDD